MATRRAAKRLDAEQRADAAVKEPMVPWPVYQSLQDKYEALVKEIVAMKRDGFVPVESHVAPKPVPDVAPVIRKAITELGVDDTTERHLVKQAWEMIRGGMEPEEIALRITAGDPVEF